MSKNTFAISAAIIMILAAVVSPSSAGQPVVEIESFIPEESPVAIAEPGPCSHQGLDLTEGCSESDTSDTSDPPNADPLGDSTDNGYQLTANGDPASRTSPQAKYANGFDLDGTDDYLAQGDQAFVITGDLTVFIALDFDDSLPARQERLVMHGAQGETEATNFLYMLDRETDGRVQYMHESTGASNIDFFSTTTPLTAGFHTITLVRDVSERHVIVTVDGLEVINQQWSIGQDPVGGASGDLFLGSSMVEDDWFLDGGIYETRIWNRVVPAATLAKIANPSDDAYAHAREGTELALWYMGYTPSQPPQDPEEPCPDALGTPGGADGPLCNPDICPVLGPEGDAIGALCDPEPAASPRLPPNWLDSFEVVASDADQSVNHDWDGDGMPDILDAINLPSEAQASTMVDDSVSLVHGLSSGGFVLLVAPDARHALLIAASGEVGIQAASEEEALDWFEATHGVPMRNAMANVLHQNTSVQVQHILPNTPLLEQALPWTDLPADGTWLLVRSDATRGVQLALGGSAVAVSPPLTSRLSDIETQLRWEFLNLHGTSFCYDEVMQTGASACHGNTDPGWIRAYSGQAAAMLQSLEAALFMQLMPLRASSDPVQAIPDVLPMPEVHVDGSMDTFTFATGGGLYLGGPQPARAWATITLTAPDGQSMVFNRLDTYAEFDADPQVWRLDGTQASGPIVWAAHGNLDGAPADGTWHWTIAASPFYVSWDEVWGEEPDITLEVQGKTIRTPYVAGEPLFNNPQHWNWHITEQLFQDDAPSSVGSGERDENVQADEDLLHARYFAPEGLNVPASRVSVEAADTITFASGVIGTEGTSIVLVAPDGNSMTFTRQGLDVSTSLGPQVWRLDGTRLSGPDVWSATGDLMGAAADGTWGWFVVAPTLYYRSYDDGSLIGDRPDIELSVAGKAIRAGFRADLPFNHPQLWNWHVTASGATFQDESPDDYPEAIDPDEDSLMARYFARKAPMQMSMQTSSPDAPDANATIASPKQPVNYRVPHSEAVFSAFDEDSPWRVMGDESRLFEHGVGIDYLFGLDGLDVGQALITQANTLLDASQPTTLRRFHFEGSYIRIPTDLDDLRQVRIGIESIDGDAGQAFLLDGRALDGLLDFDGAPYVEIDQDHQEGFAYEVRDVDGDGFDDILVWVPHFSQAWLRIGASECSTGRFWDVELVGVQQGWITGSCGAVYKYNAGWLTTYPVPGITAAYDVFGLHVLGANEFYVVGGSRGCPSTANRGFIIYYNNGFFDPQFVDGGSCSTLYDIWVNPSKTKGFAAGAGLMLQYNGLTWTQTSAPGRPANGCGVMDIDFNDQGRGYLAISQPGCASANPVSPIMYYDGTQFSAQWVSTPVAVYDVRDSNGGWAAGLSYANGAGIYKQSGTSWSQVYAGPAFNYFGTTAMPGTDTTWFSGSDGSNRAVISKFVGSQWSPNSFTVTTDVPSSSRLWGIEVFDRHFGLAVGEGTILFLEANEPPVAAGTISATSLLTQQTLSGDGTGSYDPDGNDANLAYHWSWGDGAGSSGKFVSHKYNHVGQFAVQLTVTDEWGDDDVKQFGSVSVGPESISLGASDATFLGAGQRHHYMVSSSAGQFVEAKLSSCSGAKLLSRIGSPVTSADAAPAWPTNPQSNTLLAGYASQTLYLAIARSSGSGTCTLAVKVIPLPSTPVIQSLPSTIPTNTGIELKAYVAHLGGYDTRIEVNWGDGSSTSMPATGLADPGFVHSSTHSYSARATRTVTLRAYDEFGQASLSMASASVLVRDPAASTVGTATGIGFYEATLAGSITDYGGAASSTTKVRYLVYQGGSTPVKSSAWFTGSVPTWTATALTSGTLYSYRMEVDNLAWLSQSSAVSFQTAPTTSATTTITGATSTTRGSSEPYTFHHTPQESGNVRYHVNWGDGTTSTSGWVSPTVGHPMSHTYDFPYGTVAISAQMEITSGSRTASVVKSVSVGGSSPVASFTHVPKLASADLSASLGSIVQDGSTQARITYYNAASASWKSGAWTTVSSSATLPVWTPTGLDVSKTYQAHVEFKANAGDSTWKTPNSWAFASNARPVLSTDTASKTYNYLDPVRVSAVYTDREGDAPSLMTVTINGVPKNMHATGSNYAAGVEYYYVFGPGELPAPGSYIPTFRANDAYQSAIMKSGGSIAIKQAGVASHTFEQDTPGATPTGYTKSSEALNYWQVVNTDDERMPGYVALGNHGNAAWFGRMPAASYQDPNGGSPRGSLYSAQYDLSTVQTPVMSFSSYYDTEDLTNSKDRKEVYVSYKNPGASSWQSTQKVLDIKGYEGGYKKWTTQTIDLAPYAGKVVRFEFRFDAIDNQNNNRVGWLIDDIGIGHDHDRDGLPDRLEENRFPVQRAAGPGPVRATMLQSASSAVVNLAHPGAEDIVLNALIATPYPGNLHVEVLTHPHWHTAHLPGSPAPNLVLVLKPGFQSNGADTAACGYPKALSSPTQALDAFLRTPPGSPYGFGNSAPVTGNEDPAAIYYKSSPDGVKLQVDLVKCLRSDGQPVLDGSLPVDVVLRIVNLGQTTAWIEDVHILSDGRTSAMRLDSDTDGVPDNEEHVKRAVPDGSGTASTPFGVDMDRDGVPAHLDIDDRIPQLMSEVMIDFSKIHEDELTFYAGSGLLLVDARFERGDGRYLRIISHDRGMASGWERWTLDITDLGSSNLLASFLDEYGAVSRVNLLHNGDDFTGVGFSYSQDKLGVSWTWDAQTFQGNPPIRLLFGALDMLDAVLDVNDMLDIYRKGPRAIPVVVLSDLVYSNAVRPYLEDMAEAASAWTASNSAVVTRGPKSDAVVRAPWTDVHGVERQSMVLADHTGWFDGVDMNKARTFLATSPTPMKAGQVERWFKEDTSGLMVLESYNGIFTAGKQVPVRSWGQVTSRVYSANDGGAGEELFSTERILASDVYNQNGYEHLACHLYCYGRTTESPTKVSLGAGHWLAPMDPSTNSRRQIVTVGMADALRLSEEALSDATAPWDHKMAQNTLGLETLLYTYRLARDSSSGRGPTFETYWGSRDLENCEGPELSKRRCMNLDLGNLRTPPAGAKTDPFEVKFKHKTTGSTQTEVVAVSGHYTRYADIASWGAGLNAVDASLTTSLDVLDSVDPGGNGIAVGINHRNLLKVGDVNEDLLLKPGYGEFQHAYQGT